MRTLGKAAAWLVLFAAAVGVGHLAGAYLRETRRRARDITAWQTR